MDKGAGKRGPRCQICTRCGLCPGVAPVGRHGQAAFYMESRTDTAAGRSAGGLSVLAEDALSGERLPLGDGGTRLAVADVGTTTIAMLLYHRDGTVADRYLAVNPQTMYGADVISRIRAAESAACAAQMRAQVTGVLECGLRRFGKHLGAGENLRLVLAGNTVMTYLLMGWDTEELGHAPFAAGRLGAAQTRIADVPCFVFPGISAFVGGDVAAGMYACRMAEGEEIVLLVDLGTNGEIVLGNRRRRIACATAAGPAFEGGANKGVWGADMVSLLAALLEEKVLDHTGLLAPEYFEKGVRVGNVHVTQEAVRSIQLAKAAVAAGIEILLERYGMTAEAVDRVVLAGGFGYYLKPRDAARIGLLPDILASKAVAGGNTVLAGALRAGGEMLRSGGTGGTAARLEEMARVTESLNLALVPGFGEKYVGKMDFF